MQPERKSEDQSRGQTGRARDSGETGETERAEAGNEGKLRRRIEVFRFVAVSDCAMASISLPRLRVFSCYFP